MKQALLSRGTVLAIVGGLTAAIATGSVVPQAFSTPPARMAEWRAAHPALAVAVAALRLDRVYTHPVFTGLLFLALLALGASTWDQVRAAVRRTRPRGAPASDGIELAAPIDAVARELRTRGYLAVRRDAAGATLVRHPWGHWGNVLLHVGLLTVAASSTVIGATQRHAAANLIEGETFHRGARWFSEENGVAASRLVLPFDVRLDHVEYAFWPQRGIRSVTSTLALVRPAAPPEAVRVSISDLQRVDGLRIYQGAELGHAFRVNVAGEGGEEAVTLLVEHPPAPDVPGANDYADVLPGGELLRAKYYVDADRRTFDVFNPVLTLRVDGRGGPLGEATLRPGTSAQLGPYRVRLEKVSVWARIFFVDVIGIGGVFAGFAVIALGGLLHYFTPPREAALSDTGRGTTRLAWRAARFGDFYADEYDSIRAAFGRGEHLG